MRRNARHRAAEFSWDEVSQLLTDKISFIAATQGVQVGEPCPYEKTAWPVFVQNPPRLVQQLVAAD